jgi:hypothetical protein
VVLWLILAPVDHARATEEVTLQVSTSETSTATISAGSTVTIENATATIEAAQTAITQAETATAVIETQATAITSPTETITATITQAQTSITQAQAVVDSATVAIAQVDSATVLVADAEENVAIAQIAVDSQTATVGLTQTIVDSATATVSANTTPGLEVTIYRNPGTNASPTMGGTVVYTGTDSNGINEQWGGGGPTVNGATITTTETFAGNRLNTNIGITVNGTPVSTANNNEIYIGSIGFPGPGQDPSLTLRGATANTLVTLPANTTSASFQVFAKNGSHDAVVTYTDGTTSNFTIQDNVSSDYPNYVHQEVITAPAGKTISTILIPANWDYYGIDNVSASSVSTTTVTEDFQVKWEGMWTPQTTGTQYITAPADDGVRLYLDNELVIDDWFDKGGGGSTADVMTTAGVAKQFKMWYYENGGGAAVSLMRYTGSGWEVIPASEFSTTSASPEQLQALATARNNLNIAQGALDILEADLTTAEEDLIEAEDNLQDAQDDLDALLLQVGTAVSIMNNKVSYANTTVSQTLANEEAERQAAEQARLAAIAAENARIAAQQAYEAEQARIAAEAARVKAEAEAKAAAEAAAKAEADRIAAEEAAKKAEADRIKAEEEAAKAKAEADKAEADRLEAEAKAKAAEEAKAKAEAEAKAKAEADAKKLEEQKKAEEAKAKAEEDKAKAEADAAKAEEERLAKIAEDAKAGKEITEEEKAAVVESLVADLKPGESISAAEVKASGVSYSDLPPSTPVEVRTSESGEVLVITAEVAANVELVQDPGALLEAALTDPGAALAALGSIGADMTESEREEATDMVVATVVAAGAALNAVGAATGGSAPAGGGSSGGGPSGGTNSGGSRRNEKW